MYFKDIVENVKIAIRLSFYAIGIVLDINIAKMKYMRKSRY